MSNNLGENFHQSRDKLLSHGVGEFGDDAEHRRHDEDRVVHENNLEVSQPLDLAEIAKQIEVGYACCERVKGQVFNQCLIIQKKKLYWPRIRDKSGSADASMSIKKLFAIKCVSEVFRRRGLSFANSGIV